MRLLITGVPGCGKTVLAEKISKALKAKHVGVNEIVAKSRIYSVSKRKEKLVDVEKLERILRAVLGKEKNSVVESHLLCEMSLPCDRIIVLRCNPLVLKKRLEKRGYPAWKLRENVLAEMLDYCAIRAGENYAKDKIVEIDFTKPLPAKAVLKKKKSDSVDWMREFGVLEREIKGFLE
ncbi:AAA family ATPase [Candidatus Micrarchaeota archaeon]|nr:AAA family ATPase [Candidatus Micrarchaeota archaeon]